MQVRNMLLMGAVAMGMAACQPPAVKNKEASASKILDPANMDTTIFPGDNFFMYANGTWLKKNPIPKDQSDWGSFTELQENNYKALHALLDSAAAVKNAPAGSLVQKVGDYYRSGMDTIAIEKAGIQPMHDIFASIDNIKDPASLLNELIHEQTMGVGIGFSFGVSPDDKIVTKEVCQFAQGGLGMPGREYYFDKDERTVKVREAYKKYIPQMLGLMGEDAKTAEKDAKDIYDLELKLAGASMGRVEMRDPIKLYNKYDIAGINKLTPNIDWKLLLEGLKASGQDTVLVAMPKFFTEFSKQLKATPVDVWKKYLKFHMTSNFAGDLSSAFDKAHFDFYGKTLYGQEVQTIRWKRILQTVDGSIGDLLGQLYVDKNFTPDAKKRMLDLVNNLQQTYAERIQKLDWMSEPTKKLALTKLNAFMKKIGYTDKWKDYSALTIVPNDYIKNELATGVWAYNYNMSKLGHPVDRKEWSMTPPTVNAYYNPAFNEIVFPAGILQYPFFDQNADDAVNYGGIGAVIGHEMTHGFDDQGRLYNAEGNLANWWTPIDSANFVNKANQVVNQFNALIVIDTCHANGALTEGENLADLGGLNIAYEAFKKTEQGKSDKKIDGFTPDQRFFLSWAQVRRENDRPESIAARLKSDPHSPSLLRCNVPISNMEAWYKAFNIKSTDKLFRPVADRIRVW